MREGNCVCFYAQLISTHATESLLQRSRGQHNPDTAPHTQTHVTLLATEKQNFYGIYHRSTSL